MTTFDQRYIVDLVKTRPPQNSAGLVQRRCLDKALKPVLSGLHVLVLAPVGYGKTSLLMQLYDNVLKSGRAVAWLTISEDDSDAVHFLAGVTAAMQALGGNIGNLAQSLLNSGLGVSYKVILTTLLNEILLSNKSITLFLDDLHRADSQELKLVISELMENSPNNLHIVLASRNTMPVFWAMKARSKLVEVSSEDLRLSFSEAEELLSRTCPQKLNRANIFSLMERVDGWINGLQIAALSIDTSTDVGVYIDSLSGKGEDFSSYIEQDIFSKLSVSLQDFLVETSILEVLTPELCDVVTGGVGSLDRLHEISQLNLFLNTLDAEENCYRYHHFFRDFLRSKLADKNEDHRVSVHRRAYEWCLKQGLTSAAIDHMQSAGDWDLAGDTIADHVQEMLSRNCTAALKRWIDNLPRELVDRRPDLLLSLGWVAALGRNAPEAYYYVSEVERLLDLDGSNFIRYNGSGEIKSNIAALLAVTEVIADDSAKMSTLAHAESLDIPAKHIFFRDSSIAAKVCALMYEGRYDQGHRIATELQVANRTTNFRSVVYSHVFRGMGYRLAASLHKAKEQYETAQSIAQIKFGGDWLPFSATSPLLAEIFYEWGQFDRAKELLKDHEVTLLDSPVIEPLICSFQVASRLSLLSGDTDHALQVLAEGEAVGREDNYPRLVAAVLNERIRQLISLNEIEAAAAVFAELKSIRAGHLSGKWSEINYYATLGICRYLIATRKVAEALSLISEQVGLARKRNQYRHLLKLLVLEAEALSVAGKARSAANRVVESVAIGAHGGFLQSFVDSGDGVANIFRSVLSDVDAFFGAKAKELDESYIDSLQSVFEVNAGARDNEELILDVNLEGVEPLTPREITLLKSLARGLKNKELAEEMHLSVHTVAWHLKNLYSKLGVDNRTAAVNVARHLKL